MTHVDLDEAAVDAIFGEVTDIGMPQAVDDQGGRETEGLTISAGFTRPPRSVTHNAG